MRRAIERLWSLLRDIKPRSPVCSIETQTFPDVMLRVYRRGCRLRRGGFESV